MEEHLQAIRAALAAPTEEARRAGANACRMLLQALESVQRPGGGTESSLPTPLHVVPTASATPPAPEKSSEPPREALPAPSAPQDTTIVSPSAAAQPIGPASAVPTLPVLPGGVALGTLFGRGAGGAIDPTVVAAFVSAVKNLKPEQWVDLLLSKLLTFVGTQEASSPMALPPGPPVAPVAAPVARQPYQVQLVPTRPGWVAPSGNRRR
jgi:hypothetical protein